MGFDADTNHTLVLLGTVWLWVTVAIEYRWSIPLTLGFLMLWVLAYKGFVSILPQQLQP